MRIEPQGRPANGAEARSDERGDRRWYSIYATVVIYTAALITALWGFSRWFQ